jgi:hypothetical protein
MHRRSVEKSGPFLRDAVLGKIMGEMLEKGSWPSLDDLKAEVEARITLTPSSQGKMDVADDLSRAPLEHLRVLLGRIE